MRYSKEHKAESNLKIKDSAAELFREAGIRGATVPEIMSRAGLTVGGFYKHFKSKTALLHETIKTTIAETRDQLNSLPGRGAHWRASAASAYLSKAHRENQSGGCPIPCMATEIARDEFETKDVFEAEVLGLVEAIASRMDTGDASRDREEAWAFLATMVGGLTLARAMAHDPRSAEVLRACRRKLSGND